MHNSRSKRLFTFWLIAFALFCVAVSVLASNYSNSHQLIEKDLPEPIKLVFSGVLLVIYCPPLLVIYNCAKKEQYLTLKRRSLFFFATVATAALGTIVSVIFGQLFSTYHLINQRTPGGDSFPLRGFMCHELEHIDSISTGQRPIMDAGLSFIATSSRYESHYRVWIFCSHD